MQQQNEYQGPLAGLNVIDFGHYYAGPMAAMLLADQGANVIRIVRPGDKELPEQQYRLLNRNKKLLTLDLKIDEGKTQALSLIEKADVVIENFRPGVMKRLGLDYANVKDENPGLIYLSLPGFASNDKERAHIQAWEGVINAATGLYTDTSDFRKFLNFPPVYSWVPLGSVYGAILGSIAVMSALVAREAHGFGTVIETPLVEAGSEGFGMYYGLTMFVTGFHFRSVDAQKVRQEHENWKAQEKNRYVPGDSRALQWEKLTEVMRQTYEGGAMSGPMGYFPCSDGREINLFAAPGRMMENLMKALGLHQQLLAEGFVYRGSWELLDNNLDAFGGMSEERRRRLRQLIGDVLLTKTAEEWETLLGETACVAMIRTRAEWMALEPMFKSGVFAKMDNGKSEITVPGRLIDVSGPDNALLDNFHEYEIVSFTLAEALWKHRSSTVPLKGKRPHQKKGGLLQGIKVLDLSNGMAGPTAGFTLAQYGAEVIKLDPPLLLNPGIMNILLEVNQGKRSILLDLKTAPGQEALRRLVVWADVVIHNTLDDVSKRIGISLEQLKAINPNVIGCQVSCMGGTHRGYWELRPGFDPIGQQVSGLMAHYGTLEQPHQHGMTLTTDNMGGFALTLTVLVSVYQQRKTGHAGEGRCSLARVCNYIQLPYMITENGNNDWGEAHGQFAVGDHWWQRIYACTDGWIYVGTHQDRATVLAKTVTGKEKTTEALLEEAFAKQNCAYWLNTLDAVDIAAHKVMSVTDICEKIKIRRVDNEEADETAKGAGEILCWENHPSGVPYIMKAPDWVRIGEEQSWKRLSPTPRCGTHTKEILEELGYSTQEIEELISLRVAHEYIPAMKNKEDYFFTPPKEMMKGPKIAFDKLEQERE